nr:IS30 family transposase [uncultured Terrisporobacter sp.]
MKKARLTIEDRMLIEQLLRENYKLKDIARVIEVESSTISREIKFRRKANNSSFICDKTNKYPFVCVNCPKKVHCNKKKFYYNFREAQKDYENKLKYSRIGIDMSIDEVEYWNDYFKDKIKDKNQPILHIFKNIENEFPKSIQSFYKYVHKGYFSSINDEMLARSFSYKPRNKKEKIKTISKDNIIKKGRKIEDFNNYIINNPNANIVEMDTVIGKFEDNKCIMTLYFRKSKLMLMFIIKKYKPSEVYKVFNKIRNLIGDDLYKIMFEVILTDNGWEFSKPEDIEFNHETGEKLINVFYTEPYSSWQKGGIERNHEFIRYIIPKGISFDNLSKKNVIDIMNNINNVQRKSLDYQTPYELFLKQYGEDISKKFHLQQIPKDEINLSYKLLNK